MKQARVEGTSEDERLREAIQRLMGPHLSGKVIIVTVFVVSRKCKAHDRLFVIYGERGNVPASFEPRRESTAAAVEAWLKSTPRHTDVRPTFWSCAIDMDANVLRPAF